MQTYRNYTISADPFQKDEEGHISEFDFHKCKQNNQLELKQKKPQRAKERHLELWNRKEMKNNKP